MITSRDTGFTSRSGRSWFLGGKSTDVLSRRWKQHSMPVLLVWANFSNWTTSLTQSDTFVQMLSSWYSRELIAATRCIFAFTHVNDRFLKYFFHTLLLVRLCDNPALFAVWEVAKVWTQGTQHVSLSLHLCSRACPTCIIGERALLCCGRYL